MPRAEKQKLSQATKDAKKRADILGRVPGRSIFGEKASRAKHRLRRDAEAKAAKPKIDPGVEETINASLAAIPNMLAMPALRKAANTLERRNRGHRQRRDREAAETIAAWSKNQSIAKFKELTGLTDEQFTLEPGLCNGFIAAHRPDRTSSSSKLIGYLKGCKRDSQNLTGSLLYSWALKARTVLESEAARVCDPLTAALEDEEAKGTNKPKNKPFCWQVGMCLCDEQGKMVWQMSKLLIAAIKFQFPFKSSYRRSHLKMSKVFVLLRGCESHDPCAPWAKSILLHIGINYLSPFRPTFRLCELEGDADANVSIPLKGTTTYWCLFPQLMQQLQACMDFIWFARFYFISESNKPFPLFDVSKACMRPVQQGGAAYFGQRFWPPRRRGAGKDRNDDGDDGPGLDAGLLVLADAEDPDDGGDGVKADEDVLDDLVAESFVSMPCEQQPAAADDTDTDDYAPSEGDQPPPSHPPSGSSSSSSDSDADSGTAAGHGKGKDKADISFAVPGGTIRFYSSMKDGIFTATCDAHAASCSKCVLTRQATESLLVKASTTNPKTLATGRPLGLMMAWLQWSCKCASKEAHFDKHAMAINLSQQVRGDARNKLEESVTGRALLAKERKRRPGEGHEPEGLP